MKKLVYIVIAFTLFAGCRRTLGIQRGLEPEQRLVLEVKKGGCALIRTRLCDVAAEPIDHLKWKKLLEQGVFTGDRRVQAGTRIPKFLFFHLVVSNVGTVPLVIDSVTLHYGTVEKSPVSVDEALSAGQENAVALNGPRHPKRVNRRNPCHQTGGYLANLNSSRLFLAHAPS